MKSRIVLPVLFLTSTSFMAYATDLPQVISNLEAKGAAPQSAISDTLANQHERALADLASVGYINDTKGVSRSEYIMKAMEARLSEMESVSSPTPLGFEKIANLNDLNFRANLAVLPDRFTHANSGGYVFPGSIRNKRLLTKTDFGVLLIDEGLGEMSLDQPNLNFSGYDAKVVHAKHKNDSWSTTIYAGNSEKVFIIESSLNLRGAKLSEFISFAEELVLNN